MGPCKFVKTQNSCGRCRVASIGMTNRLEPSEHFLKKGVNQTIWFYRKIPFDNELTPCY